ncbi:MAG: hypothetical protein HY683_03830 [Chloroflexi bacterium]|nr:hypothetical protein [Chloroflexota bacterium]
MPGQELTKAIARLRLLLSTVESKLKELDEAIRQFQAQLARAPGQAIYSSYPLEGVLAAMAEVQERLNAAQTARQHLLAIQQRVQAELDALRLTQRVQEVKEELAKLQEQPDSERVAQEVQRLEALIDDYSQQAARAITQPSQPPPPSS